MCDVFYHNYIFFSVTFHVLSLRRSYMRKAHQSLVEVQAASSNFRRKIGVEWHMMKTSSLTPSLGVPSA